MGSSLRGEGGAGRLGRSLAVVLLLAGCHRSGGPASMTSGTRGVTPTTAGAEGRDHVVGDRVAVGAAGGTLAVAAVERNVDAGHLFAAPHGLAYFAAHVS